MVPRADGAGVPGYGRTDGSRRGSDADLKSKPDHAKRGFLPIDSRGPFG